ncbi:hypothetical protein BIU95_07075 [Curtobacterium sp. MCBA15_007]|nr:hypothetical protein BIU95_07075 [Curtobacterium sp. MCBA15_007]
MSRVRVVFALTQYCLLPDSLAFEDVPVTVVCVQPVADMFHLTDAADAGVTVPMMMAAAIAAEAPMTSLRRCSMRSPLVERWSPKNIQCVG